MLRLASLLWRLRRATTMETGLFEIQADYLREFMQHPQTELKSQEIICARLGQANSVDADPDQASHGVIAAGADQGINSQVTRSESPKDRLLKSLDP